MEEATFTFRVKEIAEAKGYRTAAKLARDARLPQSTVYALWNDEREDASYKTLSALANVLGVTVEQLAVPKTEALVAGSWH